MQKRITNQDVIWEFSKAKAVLEIIDDKPFRVRAYQNAIDTISGLDQELSFMAKTENLTELPGIGKELAEKITELVSTGESEGLNKLFAKVPAGMFQLMQIPGIGSKKAYRLAMEFQLDDQETAVTQLKDLAGQEKIAQLDGFGEKSQQEILLNVDRIKPKSDRFRIDQADHISNQVIEHLYQLDHVEKVLPLGSIRRRSETVGDIDIGVLTQDSGKVTKQLKKYDQIQSIQAKGDNIIRLLLINGYQVDLKFSNKENFGAMLQHFTGSRSHNIQLRKLAQKSELSLSEHGVKKGGENISIPNEEKIYALLDLPLIPPELRSGDDEISAAKAGKLPNLVTLSNIVADTHTHTDYPWRSSHDYGMKLFDLFDAAHKLQYQWIIVGDHQPAKSAYEQESYSKLILERNKWIIKGFEAWKENVKSTKLNIFTSLEVDINRDGDLLISTDAASKLDLVIASIHSSFNLSIEEQTKRLIKAIEHQYVRIIAHPSGRLIGKRIGIQVDWEQIFMACVENHVALEINANPKRLDLPDSLVKKAKAVGVQFSLGSDAHQPEQLHLMHYGVSVARRGWLEKHDIINTYNYQQFADWLSVNNK